MPGDLEFFNEKNSCTFSFAVENHELQAALFHQKYALKLTYMATSVCDL